MCGRRIGSEMIDSIGLDVRDDVLDEPRLCRATAHPTVRTRDTVNFGTVAFEQARQVLTVLPRRTEDERLHVISISGKGKINLPPRSRNSCSRSRMPCLKCHGRTRK